MRCLLEEFGASHRPPKRGAVTVVGFSEHIFTQSSGFVTSIFIGLQEQYFCSFVQASLSQASHRSHTQASHTQASHLQVSHKSHAPILHTYVTSPSPPPPPFSPHSLAEFDAQRVLDAPLDVRLHYGHPDVLDKLHFLTRGGASKASKEIHLSEDIFAAFKTIMAGGSIVFREYHCVGKVSSKPRAPRVFSTCHAPLFSTHVFSTHGTRPCLFPIRHRLFCRLNLSQLVD